MNPAIGTVKDPITGEHCEVVRAKSGKYPLYYRGQQCGIIHGKAPGFQKWLHENATFTQAQVNPYEQREPNEPTEREPSVKTGSWLDDLGV